MNLVKNAVLRYFNETVKNLKKSGFDRERSENLAYQYVKDEYGPETAIDLEILLNRRAYDNGNTHIRERILRLLTDNGELSKGVLINRLRPHEKQVIEPVIDELLNEGQITLEIKGRYAFFNIAMAN